MKNVTDELFDLQQIVLMASFAAESHRILHEINFLEENLQLSPEVIRFLDLVEARRNWMCKPLPMSEVLDAVAARIESLIESSGNCSVGDLSEGGDL